MADVKQLLILDSSKDTYTCSVVKFKNRAFEKIRFQVDSTEFSSDLCWTDRKLKKKKNVNLWSCIKKIFWISEKDQTMFGKSTDLNLWLDPAWKIALSLFLKISSICDKPK